MNKSLKENPEKQLLSHPEWTKVHRFLKSKKPFSKSKSEKKIPKFSLMTGLKEPEKKEPSPKEYNTLEKEIKEWEVLAHMKETNKDLFRKFVNQKKRQEDINKWLFETGIKQSITQEKKNYLRKMMDAKNLYPFHPNLTVSTQKMIERMRETGASGKKEIRDKNRTFKEKTNANLIFNTRNRRVSRDEMEDSWDFPMEMDLNVEGLKGPEKKSKDSLIKTDFLNLLATKKFKQPLRDFMFRKQGQFAQAGRSLARKAKAKSAPRKTMYLKGRRPRQVENKLLNLIGESRVPSNLANRRKAQDKTMPLPVPNRGTIITKDLPKFE